MAASRDATFRLKTESDASGVDELSQAMARAEAATKKLSDPTLSPRALQRAVIDAAVATDRLKDAMATAQKTGGPATPEMTAKVKEFGNAVTTANQQVARTKDTIGDLNTQGKLGAQTFETLSGRVGTLQGNFSLAADSSNALLSGLGKAGLAAFALAEAAKLVDEVTKKLGDQMVATAEKAAKAATMQAAIPAIQRAIAQGLITEKGSLEANYAAWQVYSDRVNHTKRVLEDLLPSLAKFDDESRKINQAVEILATKLRQAGGDSAAFHKVLEDLAKRGLGGEFAKALADGTLKLKDYAPAVQKAVIELISMDDGVKKLTASMNLTIAKMNEQAQVARLSSIETVRALKVEADEALRSTGEIYRNRDAKIKALKEEQISQEEFNRRKKEITEEAAADVEKATVREIAARDKIQKEADDQIKKEDDLRIAIGKVTTETSDQITALSNAKGKLDESRDAVKGLTEASHKYASEGVEEFGTRIESLHPPLDRLITKLGIAKKAFVDLDTASRNAGGGSGGGGGTGGGGGDTVPSH